MDDVAYARCKACDSPFYPVWRPEIKQFEELCYDCIQKAYQPYDTDDDVAEILNSLLEGL